MLERLVAFGVVVALLFGVAAVLKRHDEASPGEDCLGCAAPEPAPQESTAPACPEGGCPPARLVEAKPPLPKDGSVRHGEAHEKEPKKERKGKKGRD